MKVNRRNFIKGSILAVFGLSLTPNLTFSKLKDLVGKRFNPQWEYGSAIELPERTYKNENLNKEIFKILFRDLNKILPPGTPFEIRACIPSDWGRYYSMAWYYNPTMINQPLFNNHKFIFDKNSNTFIWGRFRVP